MMNEKVNGGRTLTLALLMAFTLLVVTGAVILLWGKDGDIDKFMGYVTLVLPLTIGVLWTSRQNNEIRENVDGIHKKVNGELDAKFLAIHKRLDAMHPESQGSVTAIPPTVVEDER